VRESVWNVSNTIIYSPAINNPGDLNALLQVVAISNSHIRTSADLESEIQKLILNVVYKNWIQVSTLLKRPATGWTGSSRRSRDFVDATTPRLAQGPPNVLSGVCRSIVIGASSWSLSFN